MKRKLSLTVAFALLLIFCLPAAAQELYVRNRPFKGDVRGSGTSALVHLNELAKALEVKVEEQDGSYLLDGHPVTVEMVEGQPYLTLSTLSKSGFRVVENSDLGTIDVYKPVAAKAPAKSASNSSSSWGASGPTLVYFGAQW